MKDPRVLVVDDRENMVSLLSKVLREDAEVVGAHGGAAAIAALKDQDFDVVICDLKMPDVSGMDVLRACKRLRPQTEFILMTAYASLNTAVEALREGAYDYLTKPFDPEAARATILRALARAAVPASSPGDEVLPGLLARDSKMQEVSAMVRKFAPTDATVLILGETGTGKERVARAVHTLSLRSANRFVAVNCAAIPTELLESELFGYTKGSFTGAQRDRAGLFEEADGGTLFLDEIGDMRTSLQAKLTRVLEERAIRRLGEASERPIDVRLVAATHREIETMVAEGSFRDDLWYRLNVATVRLPPLRDRPDDIELLARRFLRERAGGTHPVRGFTPDAMSLLRVYPWPGNVRQLKAAVERASILAGDEIEPADLPPEITAAASSSSSAGLAGLTWQEAVEVGKERIAGLYLRALLDKHEGRVAQAAAHADVERESFYRLLRRYHIDVSEFR